MRLDGLRRRGFQIEYLSHAQAILTADFRPCLGEIEAALSDLRIPIQEIIAGGGGETKATQRMRRAFEGAGWQKGKFVIKKLINDVEQEATTHEIDHVRRTERGTLVLEVEWNNKDPFFDRDLENFKRLHAEGAISAGIVVTRGESFHDGIEDMIRTFARRSAVGGFGELTKFGVKPTDRQVKAVKDRVGRGADFAAAWAAHFRADKFGEATTHWRKLQERVRRKVGHPCPLLLIGIPAVVVAPE